MATINYAMLKQTDGYADIGVVAQWTPLTFTGLDQGQAYEGFGNADRSIQIEGTFGVGGSCTIEGSNDGTNFEPLTDPFNNALTLTAKGIKGVEPIVRYIRPRITAGDGTTSLTVTLLGRRNYR